MLRYLLLGIVSLALSGLVRAEGYIATQDAPRYIADVELHTVDEMRQLLKRADELFKSDDYQAGSDEPIAFVLHGPEAKVFTSNNYEDNREIIDLAAKLTAFEVVDIRVCRVWMGGAGIEESELLPFVGTVRLGPAEKKRLIKEEGYVLF